MPQRCSACSRAAFTASLLLAICLVGSTAHAEPPRVGVDTLDGRHLVGQLIELGRDAIVLQTPDGQETVPLAEAARLIPGASNPASEIDAPAATGADPWPTDAGDVQLQLAGGAVLHAALADPQRESVAVTLPASLGGQSVALPFRFIRALRLRRPDAPAAAAELFDEALRNPESDQDTLIAVTSEVRTVRGTLVQIGPDSADFMYGGRERSLSADKVFGVVFAAAAVSDVTASARVLLADGNELPAIIALTSTGDLHLDSPLGFTADIPWNACRAILFGSDRVVRLTTLPISASEAGGMLHTDWRVRVNRNAGGGPLKLDGRIFTSGFGMHAPAKVEFELPEDFETFTTTIGLDDAVGDRGSVIFRVLADGQPIFATEQLTGADSALAIHVPLAGVKRLALVVDSADQGDLGDWADWAAPTLLRAASTTPDDGGSSPRGKTESDAQTPPATSQEEAG